jgi:antitoxin VapB
MKTISAEGFTSTVVYTGVYFPSGGWGMSTAKVFQSGNSQAVRLPKDFRFPAGVEEVSIRRQGDRIILEPLEREEWPEEFWLAFGGMSPDFERPPQVRQRRETLDS